TLLWERDTGRPVHNAIVWSDARTADLCETLKHEGALTSRGKSAFTTPGIDRFRPATGLPIATYFSATKLAWLLENVPGARRRAEQGELCFGTVDTWLLRHLTGRFVTDVTNASRTMLIGLRELAWRDDLLEAFDIPRQLLPEIQPSVAGNFGVTMRSRPFAGRLPLAALLCDQQAAPHRRPSLE